MSSQTSTGLGTTEVLPWDLFWPVKRSFFSNQAARKSCSFNFAQSRGLDNQPAES